MSEYESLLKQLRDSSATIAKNLIPKLYSALLKENKTPEEARTILEHDIGDIFAKRTIRENLPDEAKDAKKSAAGEKGNEKRAAMTAARKEADVEPEIAKEAPKPARITINTDGSPAEDEPSRTEHLPDYPESFVAESLAQKQDVEPEPQKTLIEVTLPDAGHPKFGGGLWAAIRNHDSVHLTIDLLRNEIIGMETGAERRARKVMEARA